MSEGRKAAVANRRSPVAIGIAAIGTGAVTIGIATSFPPGVLVLLAILGAAQLLFALLAMRERADQIIGYGLFALTPILVWVLYLLFHTVAPTSLSLACVLNVGLSLLTIITLLIEQRSRRKTSQVSTRSAWGTIAVLALVAAITGGMTTPALAATSAGHAAQAKGGMASMGM